jgi:hypothetical protein
MSSDISDEETSLFISQIAKFAIIEFHQNGTSQLLSLKEDVAKYVVARSLTSAKRLLFSPHFVSFDFQISYESGHCWTTRPFVVHITITNPMSQAAPLKSLPTSAGRLSVLVRNTKNDMIEEFLASTTTNEFDEFLVNVHFRSAGIYNCMAQFDGNDLQDSAYRVQVGAAAILESIFSNSES